jgi:hypothetical protein
VPAVLNISDGRSEYSTGTFFTQATDATT